MTKQEAIKQAYGEHWDSLKEHVNERGWLNTYSWLGDFGNTKVYHLLKGIPLECMDSYHREYCYRFRPKSLSGIEDNNGWIKIESEEDLPKENIDCHYIFEVPSHYHNAGTKILTGRYNFEKNIMSQQQNYFTIDNFFFHRPPFVTHYKPIEQPKPPIY